MAHYKSFHDVDNASFILRAARRHAPTRVVVVMERVEGVQPVSEAVYLSVGPIPRTVRAPTGRSVRPTGRRRCRAAGRIARD